MTQTKPAVTASSTGKWKPYPAYKDSGVEWLGEIPVHWDVRRLKYLTKDMIAGPFGSSLTKDLYTTEGYRVYGQEQVIPADFSIGDYYIPEDLFLTMTRYAVNAGDVLVSCVGTFGKVAVVPLEVEPGIINPRLVKLVPNKDVILPAYLGLLLRSQVAFEQIEQVSRGGTMGVINLGLLSDLLLSLPSLDEQRTIATYLDCETARINALIAKKEQSIELLQEKRSALISHAVTKGLDPTVPMKDSGVEWLGEIPAHWEVKRIRDITELLQTGPFGSQLHASDYSPYGIPVINPSHLKDGHIYPDWDCAVNEETYSRLVRHELRKGDIVFARRGEMGRCALITEKEAGWLCGTGSLLMRPRVTLAAPSYLNKVLSTYGVKDWLLLESVGSTMDNLNTNILSRIPLPIPPLSEQYNIITYLDSEIPKIDALISRIREGIEKLKEYSTALISSAVTGKIDVRGEILSKDD